MRVNMPFGFIGSFKSSGKKHCLLALKAGSVLVTGALLVASCASSSSEQQQTATEAPAATAAPEPSAAPEPPPPVETTMPESPPEETSAPPPQSAAPDTAAIAACVGELAAMAGANNVPEEDQAAMTRDWEDTCAQFIPQIVGVAESARQFGADSACVERVLANAMATPFAFFNAYAESAQNAQGDEPTWGQFGECMP